MELQININFLWVLLATILVFFMQAGFGALEVGLTRKKNGVNVMMKNMTDFVIGSLLFATFGFSVMFGFGNSIIGYENFFFKGIEEPGDWSFMLFQIAFASTAATIVSGAVAERMKFSAYVITTILVTSIIYPIFGHWAWGSLWNGETSGWLENLGFMDFAGSTVVHSVGAWLALAGIITIGARRGKIINGEIKEIKGSNPVLAAIGMFLIWFGWFGFNAGSTLVADSSIALIALNTQLGAVSGGIAALIFTYIKYKKTKLHFVTNGILGGLVSITAGCNVLTPITSIIVGFIGGLIVCLFSLIIERKWRLDDAVGAVSVHGFAGAWGTLSLAIFAPSNHLLLSRVEQIGVQALGIFVCFLFTFISGIVLFKTLKYFNILRVTEIEEEKGLDVSEHDEAIEKEEKKNVS